MGANIGHKEILNESSGGVDRRALREVAVDAGTPECAQVVWVLCPLTLSRGLRFIVSKAKYRVAWHEPTARMETKSSL